MSFIKLIILVGTCLDLEENPLSFLKKEYTKRTFRFHIIVSSYIRLLFSFKQMDVFHH